MLCAASVTPRLQHKQGRALDFLNLLDTASVLETSPFFLPWLSFSVFRLWPYVSHTFSYLTARVLSNSALDFPDLRGKLSFKRERRDVGIATSARHST